MHANFSQMLLKDHFEASQMPEHNLIQWTDGNFPAVPDKPSAAAAAGPSAAATSSASSSAAAAAAAVASTSETPAAATAVGGQRHF